MREEVGKCSVCEKTIYCLDGFLDGIITKEKILYCFSCSTKEEDK
ncbi:hypothetical protein [uncultured Metabacillus sp.]|nr:hypothetical protein [uncultured Metabacillus sp.]